MVGANVPKGKPENPTDGPQQAVDAAERVYFRDACAYTERALLIIVGATVTVLAWFLSQVWSSAGVPFRTELAQHLVSFGWLFMACFMLPPMRLIALRPALDHLWWPVAVFLAWAVGALAVACNYIWILKHLGYAIVRYAAIPTPPG